MQQNNWIAIAIEEAKKMRQSILDSSFYNEFQINTIHNFIERLEAKASIVEDDGWIKFEDESPQPKNDILICLNTGWYATAYVDDENTLVFDNETTGEFTFWKYILPPKN